MSNVSMLSKSIRALLLSLSLAGCATPGSPPCRVQAPFLHPTETAAGIVLSDDELASLLIYIEALERCAFDY